ncbi:hypothetical protein SARC_04445 [Sphaeroforma arctica JP610]|uniref:Guanylate cyclase domain-containing protein n=1 Tax=Sphaeroforma arctica JP610 TaxID=667725 RepID=A0A0L0G384_9EUKA|nr:hypothetical protein SARC_04445 [Sphaeroforma arctica JP610]KNC83301.1 hypothetical protein SARC_04445 [Sphaeroforma arctica JP610]|eukprot:XP_014157203.1 hypothetical protein SARC_04445 [Sphaeroforma arctica JP610]
MSSEHIEPPVYRADPDSPNTAKSSEKGTDKYNEKPPMYREASGVGVPSGNQTVDTATSAELGREFSCNSAFTDRVGAIRDKPADALTSQELLEEVMADDTAPSLLRLSLSWQSDAVLEIAVLEAIVARSDEKKDIITLAEEDTQHAAAIGVPVPRGSTDTESSSNGVSISDLDDAVLADRLGQWSVEVSVMNAGTVAEVRQTVGVVAKSCENTTHTSSTNPRRHYQLAWYEIIEHDVQKPITVEQEALRRQQKEDARQRQKYQRRSSTATSSGNESDGSSRRKSSLLRTMGWMTGQGQGKSSSQDQIESKRKVSQESAAGELQPMAENRELAATPTEDTGRPQLKMISGKPGAADIYRKYNVVITLYRDDEGVGEVSLPLEMLLRSSLPITAWLELSEIDQSFKARLQRVGVLTSHKRKKNKILTRFQQDWEDPRIYLRKLISLETLFIIITLCQILFATLIVTVILYRYAYSELTSSAEMVSKEVRSSIIDELSILMEAVQVQVVITATAIQVLIETEDWSTASHLLQTNFESQRSPSQESVGEVANQNISQLLYFGTSDSQFISTGLAYIAEEGVRDSLVNYRGLPDYSGTNGSNMIGFGLNQDCGAFNFSCTLANFSNPRRRVEGYNPVARPWYIKASESSDYKPIWTDTYPYVGTGGLGITAALRFPRNPARATEFVTAADVALAGLDEKLANMTYYISGYGYIWEADTYWLVASSLAAPIRTADGERIPISESTQQDIQMSGQFVTDLCNFNPKCVNQTIVYHYEDVLISLDVFESVGLNWVVTVVIPNEDFLAFYDKMLIVCVIVALADTVLTVLLTILVVSSITGKLTQATKQLANFSRLDFASEVPDTQSFVKEICRIYEALVAMRLSLRSFSKYVPPSVVKILVEQGQEARLGGHRRVISIFFSDIAGFSQLSETVDLDQLLPLLGTYLQEMSVLIQDNEGIIDKFIGDHIMALWNAPDSVSEHAYKACETALLSQARLTSMRWEWEAVGCPYLQSRIGIHTGDAIVGNFGSADRLNYTALGDSVNLASRLQGLNDMYGTDIIISAETQALVSESFVCRPLDVVAVKGRQQPIWVYELVAHRDAVTPEQADGVALFSDAFARYQAQDLDAAAELFGRYIKEFNLTDKAANMHLRTCLNAPEGFQGFRVMTTK